MAFSEEMLGLRKALRIVCAMGIPSPSPGFGDYASGMGDALKRVQKAIRDEMEHDEGPTPF